MLIDMSFNKLSIGVKEKDSNTPAKGSIRIDVRNLVTEKYTPSFNVTDITVPVKVNIDKNSVKSINLSSINFCNAIPLNLDQGIVETYIESAFNSFNNDNQIIVRNSKIVNCKGTHEQRIKSIITNYVDEAFYNNNKDYFRKSDIPTGVLSNERGAFRVIAFYQIEPKKHKKQKHSKHFLNILFFDPYHLFIPSSYKELDWKENSMQVYEKFKGYTGDIGDMVKVTY